MTIEIASAVPSANGFGSWNALGVPLALRMPCTTSSVRFGSSAITFAAVLIFMQLRCSKCESSANVVTDMFDYDLPLTSSVLQLAAAGKTDLSRLYQVRSAPGVATACPAYRGPVAWTVAGTSLVKPESLTCLACDAPIQR